jgi:hypothetical protein
MKIAALAVFVPLAIFVGHKVISKIDVIALTSPPTALALGICVLGVSILIARTIGRS